MEFLGLPILVLMALTYVVVLASFCFGAVHLCWSLGRARRAWLRPQRAASAAAGLALAREREQILDRVVTFAILSMSAPGLAYVVFPLLVVPALGFAVIARANDARHRRPSHGYFWPVIALPAVSVPLGAFFVLRPWFPPVEGWWWFVASGLTLLVLAGALGFAAAVIQLRMLERHDREIRDRYLEVVGDSGTEAWVSGRGEPSTRPTTQEDWVASLFDRPHGVSETKTRGAEHANF